MGESALTDFWDAALSMDYESADGLLNSGLLESSNRERTKTDSFSGVLVRKHELWQGRPEYKVTSEAIELDGAEAIFKGEITNGKWKADFKARVARDGVGGKWSIRYLVVKERAKSAKEKAK